MKPIKEMSLRELCAAATTVSRWEWLDGMAYTHDGRESHRIIRAMYPMTDGEPVAFLRERKGLALEWELQGNEHPDLEDPATLGCVESLCRKEHGEEFFVEYRRMSDLYPAIPIPNRYDDVFVYRGAKTYVTPQGEKPGPHAASITLGITHWHPTRAHALIAALSRREVL